MQVECNEHRLHLLLRTPRTLGTLQQNRQQNKQQLKICMMIPSGFWKPLPGALD